MDRRGLWRLGDEELLGALRGSQDRLNRDYGEQLALLAEVLTRGLVQTTGYGSATRLLRDMLRIGQAEANRKLAHATALTGRGPATGEALPPLLPATAEAVRDGAVGAEHVEIIQRVVGALPADVDPDDREVAERTLAEAARTLDPAAIAKLGRAIRERLDQDGRPRPRPNCAVRSTSCAGPRVAMVRSSSRAGWPPRAPRCWPRCSARSPLPGPPSTANATRAPTPNDTVTPSSTSCARPSPAANSRPRPASARACRSP